ncbi:MAG: bifunctional transaldolase/phosoglucose isomerase [Dehalococcoidia bacterium]|nr:bifunctional transaldolase/phosoglucose isomerase [Dehalococcoidia bacterium]
MRVGIAADHAGYSLKTDLLKALSEAGYEVVDFGASDLSPDDDYPDFVVPLARAVSKGDVERGIAVCGSGVGASVAANKVPGVKAALVHDIFSAHQGVEDDNMNMICLGGRVTGSALAWDLTQSFLSAQYVDNRRHARRLAKIAALEDWLMPCRSENQNPLLKIQTFGQSVWLDFIRRGMLSSGQLRQLIDEDGLRGITSNPSIFEKAIGGSHDYDDTIRALALSGKSADDIYRVLCLDDVRQAADLLRAVYDHSAGRDGFVSLEVSPHLAHDTERTITEARELWAAVARPNLMIKVPATKEGLPAIRQLISEGLNINVTLLFSVDRYRQVAEAFIAGLEIRAKQGHPLGTVASVASFFVSRIDVLVDSLLDRIAKDSGPKTRTATELRGRVAIASAKAAYQVYREVFSGERFDALAARGARRQRLLWASTGTKNPSYSDIKYVEALIGPNTVNTVPFETLNDYRHHGDPAPRLEEAAEGARRILGRLPEVGLDLDALTRQLEDEGVRKFVDSFDQLISTLEKKRDAALGEPLDQYAFFGGDYEAGVKNRLQNLKDERFTVRLWQKDPSLWKSDTASQTSIRNAMGWLHVAEKMEDHLEVLDEFVAEVKAAGFSRVVHLGMGGSSLAAEVLRRSLAPSKGALPLTVLDTNDPGAILRLERDTRLSDVLFLVASKSGSTAETMASYKYFQSKMNVLKGDKAGENFAAVTDPDTPLARLAQESGFRRIFLNFPDIGGRYSALSYFGLLPAALAGVDIREVLLHALRMMHSCTPSAPADESPGIVLGATIAEMARGGRNKLTLVIPEEIRPLGLWLEQLVAESTGKEDSGVLPVAGEPVGVPSVYGHDRFFVHIGFQGDIEDDSKRHLDSLRETGAPMAMIRMGDIFDIGQEFFRWELATAIAGAILGVNPFDQPDVEASKQETNRVLDAFRRKGKLPEAHRTMREDPLRFYGGKPSDSGRDLLRGFLAQSRAGDYVGIQAYLPEKAETSIALEAIRLSLRDKLRLATTLGYGPRFLHSTGQFHKGGTNNGLFIQLTADDPEDVAVPGEPFTFGEFRRAQAMGDFETLRNRHRRVVRVHLGSDVGRGLGALAHAMEAALEKTGPIL